MYYILHCFMFYSFLLLVLIRLNKPEGMKAREVHVKPNKILVHTASSEQEAILLMTSD